MLIIEPDPRAHMPGAISFISRNALFRLISTILSNWPSSKSRRGPLRDVRGRVVHQDVDASELARRDVDQILNLVGFPDVARDWLHRGADLLRHLIQRLLLAPGDDDLRAFAHEYFGDGSPDAAATAGYDRNFVFKKHV